MLTSVKIKEKEY